MCVGGMRDGERGRVLLWDFECSPQLAVVVEITSCLRAWRAKAACLGLCVGEHLAHETHRICPLWSVFREGESAGQRCGGGGVSCGEREMGSWNVLSWASPTFSKRFQEAWFPVSMAQGHSRAPAKHGLGAISANTVL